MAQVFQFDNRQLERDEIDARISEQAEGLGLDRFQHPGRYAARYAYAVTEILGRRAILWLAQAANAYGFLLRGEVSMTLETPGEWTASTSATLYTSDAAPYKFALQAQAQLRVEGKLAAGTQESAGMVEMRCEVLACKAFNEWWDVMLAKLAEA